MSLQKDLIEKSLHLFPLSLPDELHASQVGRLHRDSGNISTRQTYLDVYGTPPFRITQWIPSNLEKFAEKLPGTIHANLELLLQDNTVFPLFATFGNASLSSLDDARPVRDQIINLPKRIVGETGETLLCVACLRADRDDHETPYIHRSHQVPGVCVCWRHKTRLLSACPFCGCPFEPKADLVLAPWESCAGCGQYLPDATFYRPDENATERELEFAQFSYDLLQRATKPLTANTLATIYSERIAERGLNRGRTTIDRVALLAALEEHYGVALIKQVDSAYRNKRIQNWLRFCSPSGAFEAPLSRHLLLANFLFDTSDQFSKAAEDVLARPDEHSQERRSVGKRPLLTNRSKEARVGRVKTSPAISETLTSADAPERQTIAAVIIEYPGITLAELWKRQHRAMKQFLKREPGGMTWLLNELTTRKTQEKGSVVNPHQGKPSSDDMSLAQKFAATTLALYLSSDKPIKVTRNLIMRQAGCNQSCISDPERFPLARNQLDSLSESNWHFYARRYIWAKLTIGTAATSASSVISESGLEHHRGLVLGNFFSNLPNNRRLRDGTIVDILSEYDINKDWEGPVPDSKFYTPGRNYIRGQSAITMELTPPQSP